MKYVALLRGINVGGVRIAMADLVTCCEELGWTDVFTVINSGNVGFSSDESQPTALQETLEAALSKRFDYVAHAIIVKEDDLQSIVASYPFDIEQASNHHYVIFIPNEFGKQLVDSSKELPMLVDKISSGKSVVYWDVPKGDSLTSSFAKHLNRQTYKQYTTVRNIQTLNKVIDKFVR